MLALAKNQWTIVNAVKEQAQHYGQRVFGTFADGTELTFAGFDEESDALASGLARLGVATGDRVMMLGYNRQVISHHLACRNEARRHIRAHQHRT